LFSTFLYFVAFCCSVIIVGATGWFIASFAGSKRDFAIIGIGAISMAYSFVAMLLTCCLAGIGLFAFIGAIMDIFFAGGMIAIAVLNRSARFGCPEGTGTTCRMFVATFAVAIIAVLAYLVNSGISFVMYRRGRTSTVRSPRHSKY